LRSFLRRFLIVIFVVAHLLPVEDSLAHPLSPALLDVEEVAGGRVEVRWKTSPLKVPGSNVEPLLPEHCKVIDTPVATEQPGSIIIRWTMDCAPRGLVGYRIGFSGLGDSKTDALVRVKLADGRLTRGVVRAAEPFLLVPERESSFAVLRSYAELGVEHILTGLDHLLFVFGLLMLVAGFKPLLETVTAFTVGHSITLSLAALGFVDLPSRPIEVLIAFSVFLLAVELSRSADAPPTLLRRFPWLIAGIFGLLHGLGFAGALAEVGLPQADIPLALFSFNVGIELGQIAFVVVVLTLKRLLEPLLVRLPHWIELVPLYAMGGLAAFWCFERAAAMLA
jgi:hydrogenase/urease accessory protein HupE